MAECVRKTAVTRSSEGRPVYIRAYTPAAAELASHTELLQPHGASMRPALPLSESAACPAQGPLLGQSELKLCALFVRRTVCAFV